MSRKVSPVLVVPCLFLLFLVPSRVDAQSSFYFWGEEGDYISLGTEHAGSDLEGTITASVGFGHHVSVSYDHNSELGVWWNFDFQHGDRIRLRPGTYRDATRFPFNDPGVHGLDVSGSGRGCNTLFGHFEILAVSFTAAGELASLAAEFEQDCEVGTPGPWLYGWVRYNSNLPPDYNNVAENGGFEDGPIKAWSSGTWTVWDVDSHFGMYSAVTREGGSLQLDFDPVPVEHVERISFWAKQVPEAMIAVDLMYADGTFDQHAIFDMRRVWTPFDVLEHLRPEGELVGLRFWGATSSSDQITTMLDDVYVRTSFLERDGFESGDLSGWDSAVP